MTSSSRLRVNQHGYLPDRPLAATLVSAASEPLPWRLEAGDEVVAEGVTVPRGHDASAGLDVHTIELRAPGRAVGDAHLHVDGEVAAVRVSADLYAPLAADALRFFHLQRSGVEIGADVAGPAYARPAGHVASCAHGGDTAVACLPAGRARTDYGRDLYEGWTDDHVLDVSGGWYDAGDQGKYVVNGGIAVAQLLGTHERLAGRAPDGFLDALREEARWELEWMLRMRVPAGQQLAGLYHHKVHDERWTPIPTLPHLDDQLRYLHRPSTAATLNVAAAAAQGARVFGEHDPAFAAELLTAARDAYAAALAHPEVLAPDTNVLDNFGGGPYDDLLVEDERYWAAVELFLTTGEQEYATHLQANPFHVTGRAHAFEPEGYDWQDVAALARIDLALVPNSLDDLEEVRASVVAAADALLAAQAAQPFGHPYAPRDGAYDWGSNGLVLNLLTVLGAAADLTGEDRFRDGLAGGIDYLLGRNALGLSYVTGYGVDDVRNQHSRWYAAQADPDLPHPPPGTVSGGPNSLTPDPISGTRVAGLPPQQCFVDHIEAYGVNELTINWNAPLVQVAALLAWG